MAGLYLHTPFCEKKCVYCDFFSAPPVGNQLSNWHNLLQRNLQLIAQEQTPVLETIFFGGGTPSLLSPRQISSILNCCRQLFSLSPTAEISLEANPADLNNKVLEGYLAAGVNRLSLGIQSFNDQMLKLLGRRHTAAQAIGAFQAARKAGFTNLSADLIFALPNQNLSALDEEIKQLVALSPDHIGIYGLSIEPGTPLELAVKNGQITECDEELYAACYQKLSDRLGASGYEHYEISNFARPTFRCRHNQAYWQREPCLAAGAGAHGFNAGGYGKRYAIKADLHDYQQMLDAGHNPAELLEEFDKRQAMSETLYLGLRTRDGIDCARFSKRYGLHPEAAFPEALKSLAPYLQQQQNRWFFDPDGWLIYDHLISHFL